MSITAPGVDRFAEVNVILVQTARMPAFLAEVDGLMGGDGVEVIVSWPVSETDLGGMSGRIHPADWPLLRDALKEFSVQMAKNR
ncbi:hypothetical protein ACGFNU_21495 [Spirillospora sp. NPDC048911]|uniref:hypothetical protein n=1 Tax=Spirillospora sp. NPDC048911 TaxID=3364527 RepID=UPI003722A202